MNLEQHDPIYPDQDATKKKRTIVIADVDIKDQACDIAEEKLSSSKTEMKSFRGFFSRIWKHNLAHEYYRQKEIAKAKREIQQTKNLYVGEKGEKTDHESAMSAIVERFAAEYEGENMLRKEKGEEKKILKNDNPEDKKISSGIQTLIKKYVSGNLTEEQFNKEKETFLNSNIADGKNNIQKKDSLYADNLLEMAKQIKSSISHGKGLDALDSELADIEIVIGKAKTGVDTEAQYNVVDKIIEKIKKTSAGRILSSFVNETTIASAVAIAYGVGVKGAISTTQRAAKWVGPLGIGLSAGIGGAVAGIRENKRLKEERAQHGREMAKGKNIEKGSKKREEMEKYRYETKNAQELSGNLKKALEDLKSQPSEAKLAEVLDNLNEINARITFSEQEKVDLISFSDAKKVEQERTALYIAAAEAKVYLNKNINADWATFYNNQQGLDAYLQHSKETKIRKDFLKEKILKDEEFNQMKRKEVAWAVTKGLGIGLGVGSAVQEIGASLTGAHEGLFNHSQAGTPIRNFTALEYIHRYISGTLPGADSSHLHEIAISQNGNVKIPDGLNLSKNSNGTFDIIQKNNQEILQHGLKFNSDGTLTAESREMLGQKGIFPSQFSNHIEGQKQTTNLGAGEYIKEHENLFSKIRRGVWADNDTPRPNKNELGLHWGGHNGTGIDKNGNFVFDVKHMMPEGSFHKGTHWNPQELIKEGKLKLLISLSKDTQNQVIEIPIGVDGNAIIDPNSEIGKIAFENVNGHAKFIGQFAEVAEISQSKSGGELVHVLATHSGEGIKNIANVIQSPGKDFYTTVFDTSYDYNVDLPYVIPIVPHRPLEKLGEKKKAEIEKKIREIEEKITSLGETIAEETTPAKKEKLENERLIAQARAAAMHTLYKLKNYSNINADKMEEGDKKFLDLTKELWNELAIHERPDRDANACLKLMELAGIKTDKVIFVKQGEFLESGITMDSAMKHGVIAEEEGKRLIIDHHGKESGRDTSAAKFVYETLIEMGLLQKERYLDNFVEFVTKCDNMNFASDEMKQVYQNYPKNLYGLSYRMKTEDILELFKNGVDPKKDLSDDYLRSHEVYNPQNGGGYEPLVNLVAYMEKQMTNGKKSLENLENAGFVFDTGDDRFGKILIDTKKNSAKEKYYYRVDGDNNSNQLEVFLKGYGGYLVWSPGEKSFVLYTQRKMDETSLPGGFSQGFNMRGNMWMKSMNDPAELSTTLEEIFSKLSGKDLKIEGKLKKVLSADAAGKDVLKLIDEDTFTETELRKIIKKYGISFKDLIYSIISNNRLKISKEYAKKIKSLSAANQKDSRKIEQIVSETLLEYQKNKNGNNGQTSSSQASAQTAAPGSVPTDASEILANIPANDPSVLVAQHEAPKDPAIPDQKQEAIANSVKKLSDSFSKLELSHDAIKEEAKVLGIEPSELAVQFIQKNDGLRPLYETRKNSVDAQDNKAVEKLAMIVILENENDKVVKKYKEIKESFIAKEIDVKSEVDSQKKSELEKEIEIIRIQRSELEDKLGDFGEQIIPLYLL